MKIKSRGKDTSDYCQKKKIIGFIVSMIMLVVVELSSVGMAIFFKNVAIWGWTTVVVAFISLYVITDFVEEEWDNEG